MRVILMEAINNYTKVINIKIEKGEVLSKEDYIVRGKVYELIGDFQHAMKDYKSASLVK